MPGWIFAAAAWGILGAGLLWKNSIRESAVKNAPKTTIRIDATRSGQGTTARVLSADERISLGLRTAGDADPQAIDDWCTLAPTVRIDLSFATADGKTKKDVTLGETLKIRAGDSNEDAVMIDTKDVGFGDREFSSYSVEVHGGDTFFFDHQPFVQIGRTGESAAVTRVMTRLDPAKKRPGYVILAGLAAAFTHVFFLLAKLACPWRKDPPPIDELGV